MPKVKRLRPITLILMLCCRVKPMSIILRGMIDNMISIILFNIRYRIKSFADIYCDTSLRDIFALYRSHIFTLCVCQKREVHFRYDGEAAVYIDNAYQCLDASCLIDMSPNAFFLAKLNALSRIHCDSFIIHIFSCNRSAGLNLVIFNRQSLAT